MIHIPDLFMPSLRDPPPNTGLHHATDQHAFLRLKIAGKGNLDSFYVE